MAGSASIVAGGKASGANKWQSRVALAGRLLLAILFLLSGIGKLATPGMTLAYIRSVGLPVAPLALAASALVEIAGGTALILGYRSRFTAAILVAFTLLAALIFHSNFADQNQMIHFLKNVSIAGGLLQVVAFGGGGLSIDARARRERFH
ncbi:MAG TPA: DoxX family protein [Sphingomicrobium sp.]